MFLYFWVLISIQRNVAAPESMKAELKIAFRKRTKLNKIVSFASLRMLLVALVKRLFKNLLLQNDLTLLIKQRIKK